jgi:hypothetical protein
MSNLPCTQFLVPGIRNIDGKVSGGPRNLVAWFEWKDKPGTGNPLHTQEPVTVASFRTWRGWREDVARDRCLTSIILTNS